MSFRDLQDLANDTLFGADAGLGEAVTYTPPTPPGGAPVAIVGVFGQAEFLASVGDSQMSTIAPVLDVRVGDVNGGALTGATVLIRSVLYSVVNVLGPDDSDVARLVLMLAASP